MDTIQDLNKKKKNSEHGLEKSTQGKHIEDLKKDDVDCQIKVDDEIFKMEEDLKDLPEINYEDPEIKKILKEEDIAFQKRHPNLTYDEASKSINKRLLELKNTKL